MNTEPAQTAAKLLSAIFVENAIGAAGIATGVFSVATIWLAVGEHFRAFNLNRRF